MRTKTKTYYKHTCTKCRNKQKAILRQLHKDNPKPADCTCPICKGENQDLVLDHNHTTGEFRGWICNDCNSAIGKLGDSHEVLARAIAYLLVWTRKIMLDPILVEIKANENASRRTKSRIQRHMWLMDISNPDCMDGRACGRFQTSIDPNQRQWHGWLPMGEITIMRWVTNPPWQAEKNEKKFWVSDLTCHECRR